MVAYLLIQLGLIICVVGIAFSFIMEISDYVINGINSYQGTPLANNMDSDSIEGGNMLYMLLKLILMPILLILIYWCWNLSQKPLKNW